ncbi:MAG: isoprenylcysteine carboxylmethyltransferase family protein [Pacificimonas sp.]|jgi:protein-S-isoprenylcysteine O-methyltransferase Ste14|nr:isoprenylcysteine carboxylmethyltransferase family protein [Pacificimonas sp.]
MVKAKQEPDHPGVLAPPPLIFGVPLVAGLLFHIFVGGDSLGLPGLLRWPVGFVFIMGGLAIIGLAIERFLRAQTNPEPWKPATTVVADGIFARTRNPMYLGMAIAYLGAAFAAGSALALVLLVPTLILMDRGVIAREERYMERKFGEDYVRYKRSVRRWL